MLQFAIKLGDTALWAAVGATILGLLLKLVQAVQLSLHRREDKQALMKLGPK